MTREDTITNLGLIYNSFITPVSKEQKELITETFLMAVEALKREPCEDCISRQAVLDMSLDMSEIDGEHFTEPYMVVNVEDIQKLPSVHPTQGWIPVSEKLPKAGEYVGDVDKYYLVQNEYGDMLVARYTHSEYWEQIYQHKPYADEIVAWCELPQPYIEDKEG